MLRKPRRLIPILITAFWLVMVGLFLQREGLLFKAPAPPVVARAFQPQDQWMGIFLEGGERVGRLHMKTEQAERNGEPGYSLDLVADIETSLFGFETRMDITGTLWSAENGENAAFDFSLDSGGHVMGAEGTIADKRLQADLRTGGEVVPIDFPVENGLFSGSGLGLPGSGMPPLEPGEVALIDAFDPTTMKMGQAEVACVGNERIEIAGAAVDARIYTTTMGTITSTAWIGDNDEVLQATTPFGLTLRKIAAESATVAASASSGGDMIKSLAIVASGPPAFENARRLVVRISGVDIESLPNDPPWQLRMGDTLTLLQPDQEPSTDVSYTTGIDPAPYLVSDAFVTSDHPDIVAQAGAIVGDESVPWRKALLIHTWLFENIEKIPVLSVPNALDVLRERTGDCNEHAVLFTALARAQGIPTRIAIGLVYSDTIEGFGYHAWPEVYCDGWRPMDPTLGQVAADATHIKLLNGSIEAWVRLAAYIGQIELEVVAIE